MVKILWRGEIVTTIIPGTMVLIDSAARCCLLRSCRGPFLPNACRSILVCERLRRFFTHRLYWRRGDETAHPWWKETPNAGLNRAEGTRMRRALVALNELSYVNACVYINRNKSFLLLLHNYFLHESVYSNNFRSKKSHIHHQIYFISCNQKRTWINYHLSY